MLNHIDIFCLLLQNQHKPDFLSIGMGRMTLAWLIEGRHHPNTTTGLIVQCVVQMVSRLDLYSLEYGGVVCTTV